MIVRRTKQKITACFQLEQILIVDMSESMKKGERIELYRAHILHLYSM